MATHTRAELPVVFDCNLGEDGLAEFEPEAERAPLWLRVDNPAAFDARPWEAFVAPPEKRRWPLVVVPVVVAALVAGGTAAWLGMRSWVEHPPTAPRQAAASIPSGQPLATVSTVAATSSPAVRMPSHEPSPAKEPARPALDPALERTLAGVSESYRSLNADLLTTVWPGADTASLSRTFADLKYQTLSFDRCAVRPDGPSRAVASCDVSLTVAPKSAEPALQRRRESWTLVLDRSGEGWTITAASVR